MDKTPVMSSVLEERVAMYLQAIEYATAANDSTGRERLEKDIQKLMDLMERVSVGQVVTVDMVPPPLRIHSNAGEPLANPLGELSARLADYHKALYYADIEIGENRTQQIQTLQRGLQMIQKLQEKAQAGFPIRAEEIPPPVSLPTDDEFVADPQSVITERIALYYQAIEVAQEEGKKTKVQTLQLGIQKLEYLLKRAEANIPVYKKDLPCSPALGSKFRKQTEEYRTTVELLTKMSGLSARAAKLAGARGDTKMESQLLHNAKMLTQVLQDYEMGKPLDMSACPYSLADIERLADQAGVPASQHIQDAETVRLRCNQYKLEALKAKRAGQKDQALQHMRVVKGLQALVQSLDKGVPIDMTQVPPPPLEQTPTTEEAARVLTQQRPQEPALREERPHPDSSLGGISLAEELSAYLGDSSPLVGSSSSSSSNSSRSSSQSDSSSSSPEKIKPTDKSSNVVRQGQPRGHKPLHRLSQQTPSSSGLNPLYALTQNSEQMLPAQSPREKSAVMNAPQSSQCVPNQPLTPLIPSRALKPGSGVNTSPVPPQHNLLESVNGFHGNSVILEPVRQNQVLPDGKKKESTALMQQVSRLTVQNNGTSNLSSEMTCIEILKYERMQLEKEGSDDAKVAAEKLNRQMEEEKQRLRAGGYEAWLAYLGEVEEDVTNLNCEMKLARERGQEEALSSLIIKKELAERELAVMRKRLPELQT
ncbi:coiled-coil and C2 domain-containing protein 1A-like [Littorina saxatilis]|uniref:DM14 domain-containing protein n=1 Tax=Littorina saxatilis TaxID=31220 RepID=A0AAN9B6W7_9CAEN